LRIMTCNVDRDGSTQVLFYLCRCFFVSRSSLFSVESDSLHMSYTTNIYLICRKLNAGILQNVMLNSQDTHKKICPILQSTFPRLVNN
jgi:hypothetical protein